jgi:hypothetical protein
MELQNCARATTGARNRSRWLLRNYDRAWSSPPLCEALKQLEAAGLIVQEANKCARVVVLSQQDAQIIFVVGKILEGEAAACACTHFTEELPQDLQALVVEIQQIALDGIASGGPEKTRLAMPQVHTRSEDLLLKHSIDSVAAPGESCRSNGGQRSKMEKTKRPHGQCLCLVL